MAGNDSCSTDGCGVSEAVRAACAGVRDALAASAGDEVRELGLLVRHRRALHRIPEVGYDLPKTLAYVREALCAMSCETFEPCPSCVAAFFDFGCERTRAVRADMDALPIAERSCVAFASSHPGRMHACGHDSHMAMALATADWVDSRLRAAREGEAAALPANVLFVFQPAEETSGGALSVCESGVLGRYGCDRIFGLHVWPDLPAGMVASRPGALLARSSEVTLRVTGRARHIAKCLSMPEGEVADANLAVARFLASASGAMGDLAAEEPCLCRFGRVAGGVVRNAVAGEALCEGSLRVFSDAMFDRVATALTLAAREACGRGGCTFDLSFSEGNPPVVNDAVLYACVADALGGGLSELPEPLLIAEDFASYQRFLPGVFLLLGTGTGIALHSDEFVLDERVLLRGVETYRRLLLA